MYQPNLNAKLSQMREALTQTNDEVADLTEQERVFYYGQDYKRTLFRQHIVEAVLRDELQKQGITADTLDGALEAAMLPNDLIRAGILHNPEQFDGHYTSVAKGYAIILSENLKERLARMQAVDLVIACGKHESSVRQGVYGPLRDDSEEWI